MPGVPSDRGCEACRKLRKKCDQQKPTCGRCVHVGITCVGSGFQRYKFHDTTPILLATRGRSVTKHLDIRSRISRSPSNGLSVMTSSLIATLEVTDMHYSMSHYIAFLADVPQRLGRSKVLDTAVKAVTVCFPSLYTGERTPEMLSSFGNALTCLRMSIEAPDKSASAETLSGMYLIAVCQDWLGSDPRKRAGRGVALAQILNALVGRSENDDFATEMLMTISVEVIAESIVNPAIVLEPWLTRLKMIEFPSTLNGTGRNMVSTRTVRSVSRLREYILFPEKYIIEMKTQYQPLLAGGWELYAKSIDAAIVLASAAPCTLDKYKEHVQHQAGSAIILAICLVLNYILQASEPHDTQLKSDHSSIIAALLKESRNGLFYRPLGSSWGPMPLATVLATSKDISTSEEAERLLETYLLDHQVEFWQTVKASVRDLLENARCRVAAMKN